MPYVPSSVPAAARLAALALCAAACGSAPQAGAPQAGDGAPPLTLVRTIPLPDVQGRIDHLAYDERGSRLFVAALGNDTLEVLDLAGGGHTTISGLAEPQGVVLLPERRRLLVTSGAAAAADVYDADSLQHLARVALNDDPDNVRYDTASRTVWVGHGADRAGAIGSLDPATNTRGPDIPLGGHPESFQLESGGGRLFVNVPGERCVAVVDRGQRRVLARWPLDAGGNYPMALDEERGRLFVGCRQPARLLVLDTATGRTLQSLPCVGDADDVFHDPSARRVYVCGGEGAVDVFLQLDAGHCERLARVSTAPGARTALFVPATRTLFVAVPRREDAPAEIREYRAP